MRPIRSTVTNSEAKSTVSVPLMALLLSPIVSANTLRWSPETRLSMPEKATQTAFS